MIPNPKNDDDVEGFCLLVDKPSLTPKGKIIETMYGGTAGHAMSVPIICK